MKQCTCQNLNHIVRLISLRWTVKNQIIYIEKPMSKLKLNIQLDTDFEVDLSNNLILKEVNEKQIKR